MNNEVSVFRLINDCQSSFKTTAAGFFRQVDGPAEFYALVVEVDGSLFFSQEVSFELDNLALGLS